MQIGISLVLKSVTWMEQQAIYIENITTMILDEGHVPWD